MPTTRIDVAQLPHTVRAEIESCAGPVLAAEAVTAGFNSEISARLRTAEGEIFVKGLRTDHPRAWTQRREAEINPHLPGIAPRLLWQIQSSGWHLLGFEAHPGHHADYAPGSPDLPKVAALLTSLGEVSCPEIDLRRAEQRLRAYVDDPDALDYFGGDALLHTDLNNANVLVDERAQLVDWAWATRGAPWLDAAYWVIWLMAAGGHGAASAETWAAQVPAWHAAPTPGVDAFAAANARLWREIAEADPAPWIERMAAAAAAWAAHRGQQPVTP